MTSSVTTLYYGVQAEAVHEISMVGHHLAVTYRPLAVLVKICPQLSPYRRSQFWQDKVGSFSFHLVVIPPLHNKLADQVHNLRDGNWMSIILHSSNSAIRTACYCRGTRWSAKSSWPLSAERFLVFNDSRQTLQRKSAAASIREHRTIGVFDELVNDLLLHSHHDSQCAKAYHHDAAEFLSSRCSIYHLVSRCSICRHPW